MSNIQLLPKASISSNSQFHYNNSFISHYEKQIKLPFESDKNIQLNYNTIIHLQSHLAQKESLLNESCTYSSFDKAALETLVTEQHLKHKREIIDNKRKIIEDVVIERNKMIKAKLNNDKLQLKAVLTRIIKDTLKFSEECTPMISMMPSKVKKEMEKIDYKNISHSLVNNGSISKKNETNSFLSELGLDLNNLTPDNIDIDIDKAYNFIKRWRIKREDVNEVIRMKVVNEIMNIEEKRSVKRIKKIKEEIERTKKCETTDKMKKSEEILKNTEIYKKNEKSKRKISVTKQYNDKNILIKTAVEKSLKKTEKHTLIENKEKIEQNQKNTINIENNKAYKSNKSIDALKKKESHKCLERLYGSENVNSLPHFEKRILREKCVLCKDESKYRKKFKLNAYGNVEKIVRYINSNETLKENKNLSSHFNNIKYNKKFDILTKNMIAEYNQSLL